MEDPEESAASTSAVHFAGFQTASGKSAGVSAEALQKARLIFADFDDENVMNRSTSAAVIDHDNKNTFGGGFQTASGRSAGVSAEALQKAKSLFADLDNETVGPNVNYLKSSNSNAPSFGGFQTATGKSAGVSAEALQKARSLFAALDESDMAKPLTSVNQTSFGGFQTASGKTSGVSVAALQKAKLLFSDVDDETQMKPVSLAGGFSGGFQTASGKSTGISAEALQKAKSLFAGLDDVDDSSTATFSTPSTTTKSSCQLSTSNLQTPTSAAVFSNVRPFVDPRRNLGKSADFQTPKLGTSAKRGAFVPPRRVNQDTTPSAVRGIDVDANKKLDDEPNIDSGVSPRAVRLMRRRSERQNSNVGANSSERENDQSPARTYGCSSRNHRKSSESTSTTSVTPKRRRLSLANQLQKTANRANSSSKCTPTSHHIDSPSTSADFDPRLTSPIFVPNLKRSRSSIRRSRQQLQFDDSPQKSTPNSSSSGTSKRTRTSEVVPQKPQPGAILQSRLSGQSISLLQYVGCTFPETYDQEELLRVGVHPSVVDVTSRTAGKFKFGAHFLKHYHCDETTEAIQLMNGQVSVKPDELTDGYLDSDLLYRIFCRLPDVDVKLISLRCFMNHYRWIVWKLASLERTMPHFFTDEQLTVDRVLHQMKYRYDREIDRAERSCIHKLAEGDDTLNRPCVLLVAEVLEMPVMHDTNSMILNSAELLLTDGWYSVRARLDLALSQYLFPSYDGQPAKLAIGTKLFVCRATVNAGGHQPCHPLDLPDSYHISLDFNSVRRARWDAPLGFCSPRVGVPGFSLASLRPDGGNVTVMKLVVCRRYPIKYIERRTDGGVRVLDEHDESLACIRFEREREHALQKLMEGVSADGSQEDLTQPSTSTQKALDPLSTNLTDGAQLLAHWQLAKDQTEFTNNLTPAQQRTLSDQLNQRRMTRTECLRQKWSRIVDEKREELPQRRVSRRLKLRVQSLHNTDLADSYPTTLMFYEPPEDADTYLREGGAFELHNCTLTQRNATRPEYGINANKLSRIRPIHISDRKLRAAFVPRSLVSLADQVISPSQSAYNEVDLVAVVVSIRQANDSYVIHVSDDLMSVGTIRLWLNKWQSCQLPGCVRTGVVCAFVNLQPACGIGQYRITENTLITDTPRLAHCRTETNRLTAFLKQKGSAYLATALDVLHQRSTRQSTTPLLSRVHQRTVNSAPPADNQVRSRVTSSHRHSTDGTPLSSRHQSRLMKIDNYMDRMAGVTEFGNNAANSPTAPIGSPIAQFGVSPSLLRKFKSPVVRNEQK